MKHLHVTLDVPTDLNRQRTYKFQGRAMEMALGPMDFPRRLHLFMPTSRAGLLSIAFQYEVAPDEMSEKKQLSDGSVAYFGQQSGRLIRVDIPARMISQDFEALVEMLRKLGAKSQPALRKSAHYQALASDILPEMKPRIETQVAALP